MAAAAKAHGELVADAALGEQKLVQRTAVQDVPRCCSAWFNAGGALAVCGFDFAIVEAQQLMLLAADDCLTLHKARPVLQPQPAVSSSHGTDSLT